MSSELSEPMKESVYKEKAFACQCEEHKKKMCGVSICRYGKILIITETAGRKERLQERVLKRRVMGSGLWLLLHQRNPKETPKKNVKVTAGRQERALAGRVAI